MTGASASTSGAGERARKCAWCGAKLDDTIPVLPGGIPCAACGSRTTSPPPTDAELDAAYAGPYRPASGRFSGPLDALLRRTRGRLARRLDRIAPPGAVLDVGAGDGVLLDALAAVGREAVGLERRSSRPDVREGGLEEVDERFAAVVMWHSLEHLREPGRAVRLLPDLLLPGGVAVIAVPNLESAQAQLFGERWLALDLPRHLVHLPASALYSGLEQAGLAVERRSHWRGGQVFFGMLDGLVSSLPGRPSLYDTIRRPEARSRSLGPGRRVATLFFAALLALPAAVLAGAEVLARQGGSVYVEARRRA